MYTQGIHVLGDVSGLKLANNSFDTSDIHPNYASDAILIDTRNYDSLGFGSFVSDVGVYSSVASNLSDYITSSNFNSYSTGSLTSDEYGTFMIAGQQTFNLIYDPGIA